MKKIAFFIFLTLALFGVSCNTNEVFKQQNDIAQLNWASSDVQEFKVPVSAETAKYRVKVLVRYAKNCPIESLLVHASIVTPNGSNIEKDGQVPIRIEGKNQGEGLGDLWDTETVIAEDIEVQQAGIMTVRVAHTLSKPKAPLIMKVGILVEKQ